MPCFPSSAVSALNESIRVSKALSQLAVPFMTTTFLLSSENGSPKGSAVWTGAGAGGAGVGVACAADGGVSAGDLVSAGGGTGAVLGAGAGTADGAGLGIADGAGAGEAAGAGDCACAVPPSAATVSATSTIRKGWERFIRFSIVPMLRRVPPRRAARFFPNTQGLYSSHD